MVDLNKLERGLDNTLNNETKESLNEWFDSLDSKSKIKKYPKTIKEVFEYLHDKKCYDVYEHLSSVAPTDLISSYSLLGKLLCARDAYRGIWNVNKVKDGCESIWYINFIKDEEIEGGIVPVVINGFSDGYLNMFIFPTEEMCEEFYNNFYDELKEVGKLFV